MLLFKKSLYQLIAKRAEFGAGSFGEKQVCFTAECCGLQSGKIMILNGLTTHSIKNISSSYIFLVKNEYENGCECFSIHKKKAIFAINLQQ